MSDNCDHNCGTFDDFGVKIDQKVCQDIMDSYLVEEVPKSLGIS